MIDNIMKPTIVNETDKSKTFLNLLKLYLPNNNEINIQMNKNTVKGLIYIGKTLLIVAGLAHATIKKDAVTSNKSITIVINLR